MGLYITDFRSALKRHADTNPTVGNCDLGFPANFPHFHQSNAVIVGLNKGIDRSTFSASRRVLTEEGLRRQQFHLARKCDLNKIEDFP